MDYSVLLSDDIQIEGSLASDTKSLWRRLSSLEKVKQMSSELSVDSIQSIRLLSFVGKLLAKKYDSTYRHPDDFAICAALVVLQDSSLLEVRSLFSSLRCDATSSLTWVRRVAEYCDNRFVNRKT